MDIKKEGLRILENIVEVVLMDVAKPKIKEFIERSDNKYDDMLLPFIDDAFDYVKESFVDKIDGEEG
jgi:hypothetical protein